MSVNTFSKYLEICIDNGYCHKDGDGNIIFASYPDIFNCFFSKRGRFIRINKVKRSFQETKEAIRCALLKANFKEQEFLILGECSQERTGKLSRKAAYAASWVKKNAGYTAQKAKNIVTSARHAGRVIGMSLGTGNRALSRLIEWGEVILQSHSRRVKITGSIEARIAYAEANKPFPGCTYSLIKGGVKFHLGRTVLFL